MTRAPSAPTFHVQPPALFATPTTESERCAAYVAATPDGRSEVLYATPSTDDTHLPVRPSPDGVGKETLKDASNVTSRKEEQRERSQTEPPSSGTSRPDKSMVSTSERSPNRYLTPAIRTPGSIRTDMIFEEHDDHSASRPSLVLNSPEALPGSGAMTRAPSAPTFHMQPPALFATPTTESECCTVYVAATPDGKSAARYAIPSADDTHLPVKPSPDGVGKPTRVALPSETSPSDEQSENMDCMLVADEVSQPETSREASDEQPSNMCDMSATLEMSQPERSREASFEQPENM